MKKYDLAQQHAETRWNDEAYSKAEEKGFVFTIREQKEMSKADFIAGFNAAKEEWRKCYLSCSSPYCAAHFRTVIANGTLGNMEKTETKKLEKEVSEVQK